MFADTVACVDDRLLAFSGTGRDGPRPGVTQHDTVGVAIVVDGRG